MARTPSVTCRSCRSPDRSLDSLNALPSFSAKALVFTDVYLVASSSQDSVPINLPSFPKFLEVRQEHCSFRLKSSFPCFSGKKIRKNTPKTRNFYPCRTPKILGKEGENTHRKGRNSLNRKKKGNPKKKQGKEDQGSNSIFKACLHHLESLWGGTQLEAKTTPPNAEMKGT